MESEGAYLAEQVVRQVDLMRKELDGLTDEIVNRVLDIQPTNTLFQLGTHVAGSTRYWTISNTGGRDFHRNRPSEFTAVGACGDLVADLGLLIEQINDHVPVLTADQLDQAATMPGASFSGWTDPGPLPQRHAVLHALEHIGLHLGHMQLTRQVLGLAPRSEE